MHLPWEFSYLSEMYKETQLSEFASLANTYAKHAAQGMAHRTALGMIAIFSLAGIYLARRNRLHYRGRAARELVLGIEQLKCHGWLGIALVMILTIDITIGLNLGRSTTPGYVAAGLLILWFIPAIADPMPRLTRWLLWVLFVLYCLYMLLPGLILAPDYSNLNKNQFTFALRHYTFVVYPTLLLGREAIGALQDLWPSYGLLMPTLGAIAQQLFGALTFGDLVRFVHLAQVAFFLLSVAAHRLWLPGRPLAFVGVLLLLLPWMRSFGPEMLYPNESGWRFLGIALAPLLLLATRHLSVERAAVILGFGSGILLLLNMETGVCLSVGILAYLTVRPNPFAWGRLIGHLALFLTGFFPAMGFYVLLFRMGLGYWPSIPSLQTVLTPLLASFGGQDIHLFGWDALALVIFIHTCFIVIRSAMAWRMRTLPFRPAFRMAMAIIILLWFSYYAYKPLPWALWSVFVLYLFLIPEYVTLARLRHWKQHWKNAAPIAAMVLILILMPMGLRMNLQAAQAVKDVLLDGPALAQSPMTSIEKVSGVWLPEKLATALEEKGTYVRAIAPSEDFLMFTGDLPLIALLSGYVPEFPTKEIFFQVTSSRKELDPIVHEIRERRPERLLFDKDPSYFTSFPNAAYGVPDFNERLILDQLKKRIEAHYHYAGIASHWEIWERNVRGEGSPGDKLP